MGYESKIALRYLCTKRKEASISLIGFISIIGVAISVVVLNMELAVMTGFHAELRDKLLGANSHIVVRRLGGTLTSWPEVQEAVSDIKGVKSAFPYSYNQAMLSADSGARGLIIRGVSNTPVDRQRLEQYLEPGYSSELLFEKAEIEVERPDGLIDKVYLSPIIIGKHLQRELGISVGEPVTIFSPQLRSSPQGLIPRQRRFVVAGIYSSGLVEYETGLAYAALKDTQHFFGLGDGATGIDIILDDLMQVKEVASKVRNSLSSFNRTFLVTDWMQQNEPFWNAIELEKRVYFIVLLLLVVLASFSVISTLVLVVMEKGKDIAILKSMGATNGFVQKVFFLQAVFIALAGTILGTILGYIGCLLLRKYGFPIDTKVFGLDTVPVHIIPANFIIVFVCAFAITCVAGVYPAFRASRLKPAEALRYE